MRDQSSAETDAAIQSLAREILNEINAPVPVDLSARITAQLEEAINGMLYREREPMKPPTLPTRSERLR